MREKKPSAIKKITLNRATFHDETIDRLSYVNFFYGNNGTGKSTIAHCIEDGDEVEWADGRSPENFEIAVYNQDFISDHFSDYGGLKGVFTVNKVNIEIQKQVDEKKEQQRKLSDDITAAQAELTEKEKAPDRLLSAFQYECFKKTMKIRRDFDNALTGRKQKQGFVKALLAETNPTNHNLEELKRLCDTAYDDTTREYPLFSRVSSTSTYGNLPGYELLGKPIASRSNTPFAQFIKALNATDWVRTGHEHYVKNAEGKCPFCQRPLDPDFESKIADCFDEQYQQDINDLVDFQRTYVSETGRIITALKNNLSDVLPSVDLTEYNSKLELLEKSIEINGQRLTEKVNEPTKVISLEDTDSLLLEIGTQIDKINQAIKANNDVVKGRRSSKNKCRDDLMQYLAYFLADDIKNYREETAAAKKAISDCKSNVNKMKGESKSLSGEIAVLNSQTVNTSDAMNAINNMLIESGFQGFRLRAKEGVDNTYEVIRENGEIATDLSEGERNFIAFLYSYAALWDELRDVQSTNAAKNVMRRILEYYFLQLCGYEGESLRERILESEENKNKFIVPVEGGNPDTSNYEMAMSLLSYIDTSHDVGDDLSFTEDSDNVDAYKNVFKLIFDALGQSQHYDMMMGTQKKS